MSENKVIFLDYNASTGISTSVFNAMSNVMGMIVNPSSTHIFGRYARKLLEDSRESIANSLGFSLRSGEYNIVFVSSGTEANNLVIHNFAKDAHIFVSSIEHMSVLNPANCCGNTMSIGCDENGVIEITKLKSMLHDVYAKADAVVLVSVMMANNETGVIQPIEQICDLVNEYKANGKRVFVHTDAAQVLGKVEQFSMPNVDFMTLSSHKVYGPVGIACLIFRKSFGLRPQIIGGGQEKGWRGGTENVIAAIGFAQAVKDIVCNEHYAEMLRLRNILEKMLRNVDSHATIFGIDANRLCNTSMFASGDASFEEKVVICDRYGIAISGGSACSSGTMTKSHVLDAMKVSDSLSKKAIRVSLGIHTNEQDVVEFIDVWQRFVLN